MIGTILLTLWLASGAIVWLAALYAPLGYQDEAGYHDGEEG